MAMTAEKAAKRAKATKKRKQHDQRGKDHPEVVQQAEAVVEAVVATVTADHALGHQVKELRDTGMAWWQIAYQLEMPGSGPNVAQGKSGAARARAAYKKTFGELPGDVAQRSTKASRAAGGSPLPVGRRKCVFSEEDLADDGALILGIRGKMIRWLGSTPYGFGPGALITEREARVHPEWLEVTRGNENGPMLHFREQDPSKKDRRAEQWRSVYAADIYDIRR